MPLALTVGYSKKKGFALDIFLLALVQLSASRRLAQLYFGAALVFYLRRQRSSSDSGSQAIRARRRILGRPTFVLGLVLAGNPRAAASLAARAYRPWQPLWRWPHHPVVELAPYLALNLLVTTTKITGRGKITCRFQQKSLHLTGAAHPPPSPSCRNNGDDSVVSHQTAMVPNIDAGSSKLNNGGSKKNGNQTPFQQNKTSW